MAVTIWDIAKHLNLSIATVSRALNDKSDVSAKTRQRVLAATEELGYYPSATARNLRLQETNRIGFVFSFPSKRIGEYASDLITGAIQATESADYNLLLYPLSDNQLEKLKRICRTKEVTGLLLMGSEDAPEAIDLLEQEDMPFVVSNRRVAKKSVSYVTDNRVDGAKQAVEHLVELGHTHIAFIGCPENRNTHEERFAGYKQALNEAGIGFEETFYKAVTRKKGAAAKAMQALLELDTPPTAVFALWDEFALECLEVLKEKGLNVPKDVAVVGADDLRLSLNANPPLTTIHPPLVQIGKEAVEILLRRIKEPEAAPVRLELAPELVIRKSTVV